MRWNFDISMDFGRCLRTRLNVRPVQVVKKPALMVLHQVLKTGLKKAQWRICTRAGSFFIW